MEIDKGVCNLAERVGKPRTAIFLDIAGISRMTALAIKVRIDHEI